MCCYLLSVFERAAVLQIGGNSGRPKSMATGEDTRTGVAGLPVRFAAGKLSFSVRAASGNRSQPLWQLRISTSTITLVWEQAYSATTATSRDPGATATPREGPQEKPS
jgi:hypothetical protein